MRLPWGLTEFQKEQVLSINRNLPSGRRFKEVFIAQGPWSRVFALEVSRAEYYCYTTEQKEKEKVLQRINREESIQDILQSL
ncbi:MAG: hypothetical protein K0B11_21915 [Mariniphaga sp.]|nr:hypothetical protein [Mariniphaga sp.]